MDSGSTLFAVLLAGAILLYIAMRAADMALPLLRRGSVRERVEGQGLKEEAVRRLRTSRYAYEELIRILSIFSVAAVSAFALALLVRETPLIWPLRFLIVTAVVLIIVALGTLGELAATRASAGRLVNFGVVMQGALWLLLPVSRLLRFGLRPPGARAETNGHGTPADTTLDRPESHPEVEDEIADEPLERHERAMIHAILHLDKTAVREIMVPRVDVVMLDVNSTLEQAVPRMLESGHSRLPTYDGNPDNIIGILYTRDLLAAATRGKGAAPPALRDLVRPCFFIPESKRVDEMLREFQQRRVHLAVVVDEYGGVSGIVTIEDLLEEIVGEIEDEFDREEPAIEHRESGDAVVDARIAIDRFNEEFGTTISPQGFDTLGGLLFARIGRLPTAGDAIEEAGLKMQVLATAGRRIRKVRVVRQVPVGAESDSGPRNEPA